MRLQAGRQRYSFTGECRVNSSRYCSLRCLCELCAQATNILRPSASWCLRQKQLHEFGVFLSRAGRQRFRCRFRHLGEEVGGDGEGCCGSGGWGVEEVDLAGLLLEGEIHEQGAVEVAVFSEQGGEIDGFFSLSLSGKSHVVF